MLFFCELSNCHLPKNKGFVRGTEGKTDFEYLLAVSAVDLHDTSFLFVAGMQN